MEASQNELSGRTGETTPRETPYMFNIGIGPLPPENDVDDDKDDEVE